MAGNALFRALRFIMLIPFVLGMSYGLLMTKYTHEMQSGEPGFATEIMNKIAIAWLTNRVENHREAVFDIASLNDERVVTISRTVAVTDLPGGADGNLSGPRAEIAGLAAAKQLGEVECANMIRSFATACKFSTARAQISDDETVLLKVALSFASATPAGKTEGLEGAALVPQRVRLTQGEGYQEGYVVPAATLPAERDKIYAAAEAACAALRAEKGSCVVSQLGFTEEPAEDGQVKLAASAQIAYLGQRVSSGELGDLTVREADGDASMLALALGAMAAAQRSMMGDGSTEGDTPDAKKPPVDAKSLLDNPKLPGLENPKGGAKFVTAP